jgi:hypothetical protein
MPKSVAFLFVGVVAASSSEAAVVYSNLSQIQDQTAGSIVVWDDVRIAGGGLLERFRLYGYNAQSGAPRVFEPTVNLYLFNDATGLPNGTFLGTFQPTSGTPMAATESRLIQTADLKPLNIMLPPNARLGVRIATGGNFGVFLTNPPAIGSSEDALWQGVTPTPLSINGVKNLGLELVAVAEPAAAPLVLLGAVGALLFRSVEHGRASSKLGFARRATA